MSTTAPGSATGTAIGAPLDRIEGQQKVTGTAPYAYEHHVENPLYLYPLHSDVARGRVARIDTGEAEALPGVVAVISHLNAPTLADTRDKELSILQSGEVAFRGQYIGAVVAETFEVARHAAQVVEISYYEEPHDAAFSPDRDDLYAPERLNAGFATDTEEGGALLGGDHARRDVHDAAGAQQSDGAAYQRRHLGGWRPHALRVHPGRARSEEIHLPALRARQGPGAGRGAPRRGRVRVEGAAPRQHRACRDGRLRG
jgi:CO/xanthine dehydrogenase Mo-binding subunit